MNKFEQIAEKISAVKTDLAAAVSSKGVSTPSTASFAEIKDSIYQITSGGLNPGDIIPGDAIEMLPFLIKQEYSTYAQCIQNYKGELVLIANMLAYYDQTMTTKRKNVSLSGVDLDNSHASPIIVERNSKNIIIGTTYSKEFFMNDADTGANMLKAKPQTIMNSYVVEEDGVIIPDAGAAIKYNFEGKESKRYNYSGYVVNESGYSDIHKVGNLIYVIYGNYYVCINLSRLETDEFYNPTARILDGSPTVYKTLFFDDHFVCFCKGAIRYYSYSLNGSPTLIRTITHSALIERGYLREKVVGQRIFFSNLSQLSYISDDYKIVNITLSNATAIIGFEYIDTDNLYYVWDINKLTCLDDKFAIKWEFTYPNVGAEDIFFKNLVYTSDNKLLFTQGYYFYKTEKNLMYQVKPSVLQTVLRKESRYAN